MRPEAGETLKDKSFKLITKLLPFTKIYYYDQGSYRCTKFSTLKILGYIILDFTTSK